LVRGQVTVQSLGIGQRADLRSGKLFSDTLARAKDTLIGLPRVALLFILLSDRGFDHGSSEAFTWTHPTRAGLLNVRASIFPSSPADLPTTMAAISEKNNSSPTHEQLSESDKAVFHDETLHSAAERGHVATDKFGNSLLTFDKQAEARLRLKIDLYIIPTVAILYLFCFIDRANIGTS
jgi:hypothetical protein